MIYIAYSSRSFSTAKALRDKLKEKGENVRIIKDKKFKHKPSLLIRWGNSTIEADAEEFNKKEAVRKASEKATMALTLIGAEGVNFPRAEFSQSTITRLISEGHDTSLLTPFTASDEEWYYRNINNVVERRSHVNSGDKYRTAVINREREFRVHVFNGRTMGVYEKIPNDPNQWYCKDHNSTFRRIDMSSSQRDRLIGLRPMAVAAANAMGLNFAGVDVIMSGGQFYVNEVNSAPALNEPNLDRFTELFQARENEVETGN